MATLSTSGSASIGPTTVGTSTGFTTLGTYYRLHIEWVYNHCNHNFWHVHWFYDVRDNYRLHDDWLHHNWNYNFWYLYRFRDGWDNHQITTTGLTTIGTTGGTTIGTTTH